jgi:hypothetical protein
MVNDLLSNFIFFIISSDIEIGVQVFNSKIYFFLTRFHLKTSKKFYRKPNKNNNQTNEKNI